MIELLKPKNGRWYFVGTFNQIHWAVRGSDSFPIVPLIYPFRHIQIELTWTEYEKEDQVYQGGVQRFANMDKGIGTKIEMTNIREIEEHPIVVDVILKDGYRATLIFDITLKVFEPLKLVPRKGFLTYVQQEFNDIVAPWANKKKDIDSILQLEIEEVDKDVILISMELKTLFVTI